jgi:hypothetical protein
MNFSHELDAGYGAENMNRDSVAGTSLVMRHRSSQQTQPETGRKQVNKSYRTVETDSGRYGGEAELKELDQMNFGMLLGRGCHDIL